MRFGTWLLLIIIILAVIEFGVYIRDEYRKWLEDRRAERINTRAIPYINVRAEREYRRNIERGGGESYEDRIDNGPIGL